MNAFFTNELLSPTWVATLNGIPYVTVVIVLAFVFVVIDVLWHGTVVKRVKKLVNAVHDALDGTGRVPAELPALTDANGRPDLSDGRLRIAALPASLRGASPWPWVGAASGVLVAIGVLGTFVGLAYGVTQLDGLDTNRSADSLLDSIGGLVAGMTTAFDSSIAGVGTSALLLLIDGIGRFYAFTVVGRGREQLLERAHVEHPALLLAAQDPAAQGRAAEQLAGAATHLGTAAEHFHVERLGASIGEAIQDVLRAEMKPTFDDMRDSLADIQQRMAHQNRDVLTELFKELKDEVIRPLQHELSESNEQTRRVAEAVETLHGSLGKTADRLAHSTAAIQRFQQDTLDQMRQFADRLERVLGEFRDETKGVLENVSTQVTETITQAGASASGLIDTSREHIEGTFAHVDQTLQRTRETVQVELERFREQYQSSLVSFFEHQNQLLDGTLGAHRDGLHKVVDRLTDVFDSEATRHAGFVEDHDRIAGDLRQLLDLTGATRAEVHETLRAVARDLRQSQIQTASAIADVQAAYHTQLEQGSQAVEEFVAKARDTYTRAFDDFDRHLATILESIGSSAEGLSAATEELVRTLEREGA